ncbi:MAG: restriction endonuclease subunit S [Fibrobacter sp.]|nr:restriction endonuclease subunit S [Fibrobacter sp.]MDY6389932.1 restriction endonuclease subunit S [Fibrobacter sp.]
MEIKELGDVLELQRGYDLPHSEMNEGIVPVAGSNGIIGYHDVAKLQPPCITIGRSGSVGKLHRYNVPVWPHNTSLFISDFKGNDDKYLFYLLKTIDFNKVCDSSVIPSLNRNFVYPIKIYFETDVKKQKKIASVLSALDDKIALNKKMNQKLEAMAKRLYDYWFVQYDFPDKNGHPYKTTGGPMIYNPTLKREIPVGWEVKSLFDCSDVLYGFPYATEPFDEENLDTSTKPYPVIRIRDIKDNTISAKTTETVDNKYRTKVNDLLIGMDGYFHMSFWPRNDDYVNQRITRIRQKELSVMVIYHQIAPFIKFKEDQAKGSTVGHLSDKDMKQINILVPNNLRLSEKFDGILNLITKNKREIYRLTKLRDKLLPLLMNGQVVVG